MITELFRVGLTVSCLVGLSSANCNYCSRGDNGAKVTYISPPPCPELNFPQNKNVGSYRTSQPFPIYSSEARNISTTPLIVADGNTIYANFSNVGIYLQARYIPNTKIAYLQDGVLYSDKYLFYQDQFYWASSTCGLSGTSINGNGVPIEVHEVYYNSKYGSFKESLKHPDGLAITVFSVQIRPYPNPAFDPFEKYILQIKKYGSSTIVPVKVEYPWYYVFNGTTNYYAYPGKYADEDTAYYDCATYIIFPYSTSSPYIGVDQYRNTFLKCLNQFDKSLSNAIAVNRRCDTPFVCTEGIQRIKAL